ncbi:hypothetical protein PPERSA_04398 [Pseudocohnilembus persalinus]|uniref:Uncharacterized protein n=1 Tax=Pseudocohnilembus persalinus TaxID=266149 RepID=A0A0V0QR17_PSEPJ|nr:hypothetical protein PPERSA_04398 [Pseudocohnilembus persalinus]|eukprot:KRX04583.1 hypothetical protein PPERSA_04398 [Pseudocohnilembus persalinus]
MNQKISDSKRYSNEKTNKLLFCIKRRAPWNKQPDRKIKMTQKDKEVPNNTLETTQYNIFTFFPKNFMIQISKSANLYFVLMGVIQMIPETTTTGGVPLVYSPLALIITISMVKDFLEDWKRRKEDIKENNHIVEVLKDGQFVEKKSKYIRIGDIIKIHENQMFPADIVLLKVPNNKNVGYIETKNLDGETNLKLIKVHNYFQNNLKTNQDYYDQNLNFVYEKPSPAMYRFNGYFYQEGKQEQNNNFDINNFIYRGSSLRNTKWVEGLVVYNGKKI